MMNIIIWTYRNRYAASAQSPAQTGGEPQEHITRRQHNNGAPAMLMDLIKRPEGNMADVAVTFSRIMLDICGSFKIIDLVIHTAMIIAIDALINGMAVAFYERHAGIELVILAGMVFLMDEDGRFGIH